MKKIHLLNPPELVRRSNWRDRYETKVAQWLVPWEGEDEVEIGFIGVPLSKTSISVSGASMTPNALRELFPNVTTYSIDYDVDLQELNARDMGDIQMHVTDLQRCHANIEQGLTNVYQALPNLFPIIAGGDHSVTCPSVKAFKKRYPGPVGIVQIDSHMDVRNLEDGGPSNGTPIRGLLESGTVEGKHIAQIGIHSFANSKPYREYAVSQGITQFTARQVAREGIEPIVEQAMAVAGNGTDAIYVTVDMDVLDQAYAPGVPAMVPAGMTSWQLFEAVHILGQNPKVKGFDIVCVDPVQDPRRATVRTALYTILTFLAGYMKRGK
ncbi:agmatinase family protein [Effusibacillus lacus]|uniref:Formimidoylglutamase n=1 Tax=Effusibacillus lacus TaxID=1348429 RepID=A0A292YIL9_9BACL|nr:agmatinase family protein [Effusibacillus lacus]TCS75501.1 formiminoglutamase [Effusibacillus lacus]GAX88966.1 formimidoylglutamase [Effusibacillus lacus]